MQLNPAHIELACGSIAWWTEGLGYLCATCLCIPGSVTEPARCRELRLLDEHGEAGPIPALEG